MSLRLRHDIDFSAVVFDSDVIYPNKYTTKINFEVLTEDPSHQNIAVQRILFFIRDVLHNSIFVMHNHPNLAKILKVAGTNRVVILPEEPYDQVIGMLLFHKLSAIIEERFAIDSISIGSTFTNNIYYTIDEDEFVEFEAVLGKGKLPYWWDRPDLTVSENHKDELFSLTWEDVELGWTELEEELVLESDSGMDIQVVEGGEDITDES